MKGRKSKMNKLQEEIENRHLPELMRLENGDAVTNYEDWKLRREEIKKLLCHEYMLPLGALMMEQYLNGKLSPESEKLAEMYQQRHIGYGTADR